MSYPKYIVNKITSSSLLQGLKPEQKMGIATLVSSVANLIREHLRKGFETIEVTFDRLALDIDSTFTEKYVQIVIPFRQLQIAIRLGVSSETAIDVDEIDFLKSIDIVLRESRSDLEKLESYYAIFGIYPNIEELVVGTHIYRILLNNQMRETSIYDVADVLRLLNTFLERDYEGQPAELCVAIKRYRQNKSARDSVGLHDFLESKKTFSLFTGHRHLLVFDNHLIFRQLVTLPPYPDIRSFPSRSGLSPVPYEYQPIAKYSLQNRALVLCVTRFRTILVIYKGRLIYERFRGKWKLYSIGKLLSAISSGLQPFSAKDGDEDILLPLMKYLLILILTLKYRRRGALIIVSDEQDLDILLKDSAGSDSRIESTIQDLLTNKLFINIPVSLLCNAFSIDGATLLSTAGVLKAFGRIINIPERGNFAEGARTTAAKYASKYGLAIKVSHDGDFQVYTKGHLIYAS